MHVAAIAERKEAFDAAVRGVVKVRRCPWRAHGSRRVSPRAHRLSRSATSATGASPCLTAAAAGRWRWGAARQGRPVRRRALRRFWVPPPVLVGRCWPRPSTPSSTSTTPSSLPACCAPGSRKCRKPLCVTPGPPLRTHCPCPRVLTPLPGLRATGAASRHAERPVSQRFQRNVARSGVGLHPPRPP